MSSSSIELQNQTLNAIDQYSAIRAWQDANMPIYGSLIGFDLILFLSRSRYAASPYSLKDVFHSLKYSEGALRIFIRRLERDGWVRLETWPGDRRNKKIIIHQNLMMIVDEFFEYLAQIDFRSACHPSHQAKLP